MNSAIIHKQTDYSCNVWLSLHSNDNTLIEKRAIDIIIYSYLGWKIGKTVDIFLSGGCCWLRLSCFPRYLSCPHIYSQSGQGARKNSEKMTPPQTHRKIFLYARHSHERDDEIDSHPYGKVCVPGLHLYGKVCGTDLCSYYSISDSKLFLL